jgi:type VI secretion system protein VasD
VTNDERSRIGCGAAGTGTGTGRGWAGWPLQGARVAALVVCGVIAACSSSPLNVFKAKPTSISGSIVTTTGLNPSVSQRPSPLLLRVYELRSPTAFNQAEFMALYQADQATLGPDLVAREEFTLQPGQTQPLARQLGPETRFIGVVAVYRDLEHARWRAIVPVQPNRAQKIAIHADALAVSASVQP